MSFRFLNGNGVSSFPRALSLRIAFDAYSLLCSLLCALRIASSTTASFSVVSIWLICACAFGSPSVPSAVAAAARISARGERSSVISVF